MKIPAALAIAALVATGANAADQAIKPLIVGGAEVPANEKLYTTGLRVSAAGRSFCGGSLITPRHVLTAAHCEAVGYVSVGTRFSRGREDGEQIRVLSQLAHPLYNDSTASFDFQILTLETAAVTKPISIAAKDPAEFVGFDATVIGWGAVGENAAGSNVLKNVNVTVLSDEKCRNTGLSQVPDDSMFCAGGVLGEDSCQGDSGGPIVIKQGEDDVLLGVVSWGDGCAREGLPGVYSRIAKVIDWISANAPGVKLA